MKKTKMKVGKLKIYNNQLEKNLTSGFYRCRSPKELGAHMSTLRCQNCPQGLIMPDCDISNEDSSEKYYNCNTCDTKLKCK